MWKKAFLTWSILALISGPAYGATLELQAVADATLDSASPEARLGSEDTLVVGWNDVSEEHIQRVLIRFPALELPGNTQIRSARLELTFLDGKAGLAAIISGAWSEETVTWNSRPSVSRPVSALSEGDAAWWDVTSHVAGWVSGLYPDFGLALLETAGAAGSVVFASREITSPPRLTIEYVIPEPEEDPQPPEGLGPPAFAVDDAIAPFAPSIESILLGGTPLPRPLAAIQFEQASIISFILDEVIFTPADSNQLESFLNTYEGQIIRSPGIPDPPPGLEAQTRDVEEDPSYLIKVNPPTLDTETLTADATAQGLLGNIGVSSPDALRMVSLIMRERNRGLDVTLNAAAKLQQEFPPLALEEEPLSGGTTFEDPVNEANRYPEISDTTAQATGVNRAWQYVAFSTRKSPIWVAIIDGGFCLNSNGQPCTDDSGRAYADLPNYYQYDFHGDDYNASGDNPMGCGGSPCPDHGSDCTSLVSAIQDNMYGTAGVGSPLARPMLFKVGGSYFEIGRSLKTAVKWGAHIISMSFGGECDWSCRMFSGVSGYGKVKDGLIATDNGGVLTLAAAGNDNRDLDDFFVVPCVLKWTSLCVGALAHNSLARAGFSNWGWKGTVPGSGGVDIFAPGTNLRVGPNRHNGANHNFSGTSAATPFVAGAAALAWAIAPTKTHNQIKSLITSTRHANISTDTSPGSVDVMRMALNAGPPLVDRFGGLHSDAASAEAFTASGLDDLTITPMEKDYFEYKAENYLQSAQITAGYVEPIGDLFMHPHQSSQLSSKQKITGAQSTTYSLISKDLCYGEDFIFYVKGATSAVGNAYNLTVQTTVATSLTPDTDESNDTPGSATFVTAPRESSMDLLTTMQPPDCRNGRTIHTTADVDYYTFQVGVGDLDQYYTGVSVRILADFAIKGELFKDGALLGTANGALIDLEVKNAQPGTYLAKVSATTLNAYTTRIRVYDPKGRERAWDLEDWLKGATLMAPDLLPKCPGGCGPIPHWMQHWPMDPSALSALRANHIDPVPGDLAYPNLALNGTPRYFAVGSQEVGMMQLHMELPEAGPEAVSRPANAAAGISALVMDNTGNILWETDAPKSVVDGSTELAQNQTYILVINSTDELSANLILDLPGTARVLPPPDGIWKDAPFQSESATMSFYVQTYDAGSILVIASPDGMTAFAFLDDNLEDGIDTHDLGGMGHHLTGGFTTDSQGALTIRLSEGAPVEYVVYRWFASDTGDEVNGIWKDVMEGRLAKRNFYVQTYDTSIIAIESPDARSIRVFLDGDKSDDLDVDSMDGISHLTLGFSSETKGSGILRIGEQAPEALVAYRWYVSPCGFFPLDL